MQSDTQSPSISGPRAVPPSPIADAGVTPPSRVLQADAKTTIHTRIGFMFSFRSGSGRRVLPRQSSWYSRKDFLNAFQELLRGSRRRMLKRDTDNCVTTARIGIRIEDLPALD